jgi:HAD domain in Swiss Army Knife RNA repair proteins
MRVLFLDIDGVLNRTGYRPAESVGLRSWIEPELAARLSWVLRASGAAIVLASDWRRERTLEHIAEELRAAGVDGELLGVTPVLGGARWREIEAWMAEHGIAAERVVIVDDGFDMGPLAARFVRVSPLAGLDDAAARAIAALFEQAAGGPAR